MVYIVLIIIPSDNARRLDVHVYVRTRYSDLERCCKKVYSTSFKTTCKTSQSIWTLKMSEISLSRFVTTIYKNIQKTIVLVWILGWTFLILLLFSFPGLTRDCLDLSDWSWHKSALYTSTQCSSMKVVLWLVMFINFECLGSLNYAILFIIAHARLIF